MSHLSECLRLYRNDPEVSDHWFTVTIEEAIERDLLEAKERQPLRALPAEACAHGYTEGCPDCDSSSPVSAVALEETTPANGVAAALAAADSYEALSGRLRAEQKAHELLELGMRPGPDAEADLVTAYLFATLETLCETVDALALGIGYLNELDDKRAKDIADLTSSIEELTRRTDLRAEECSALGKRLESVTRVVSSSALRQA